MSHGAAAWGDGGLRLRTHGPDQTRALGAAVAGVARPGDVVALTGELGAGKTCFVQGAAAALGVADRVTSPTFVLVRMYAGRLPVVHCDVYRLDQLQDVLDLGDEVMAPDALTFIEWGDAVAALLPEDHLEVELRLGMDAADASDGPAAREVRVAAHGAWELRLPDLLDACRLALPGGG